MSYYPAGCGQADVDRSSNGDCEEPSELDEIITYDCGCVGTVRNAEESGGKLVCEHHLNNPVQLPDYQAEFLNSVNESFKPWRNSR